MPKTPFTLANNLYQNARKDFAFLFLLEGTLAEAYTSKPIDTRQYLSQ